MAFFINDKCTACGDCMPECAFEAISAGDGKYVIDEELCADCGACADVCNNEAIEEA